MSNAREVLDAAEMPSLEDAPWAYPDGRLARDRGPSVYGGGQVYPLGEDEDPASLLRSLGGAGLAERVPVVALGSNAYPRQLLDKFEADPVADDRVPTLRAVVPDLAISYAAMLSRKGYVPVSARWALGRRCETWLQWLTVEQLTVIAATEGRGYRLVRVPGVVAGVLEGGWGAGRLPAYAWAHTTLLDLGSGPIDLEAVDQPELLRMVLAGADGGVLREGRRLPEGSIGAVRSWLRGRAIGNRLPDGWREIDRDAGDFPGNLIGAG